MMFDGAVIPISLWLSRINMADAGLMLFVVGGLLFCTLFVRDLFKQSSLSSTQFRNSKPDLLAIQTPQDFFNVTKLSEARVLVTWTADNSPDLRGDVARLQIAVGSEQLLVFESWLTHSLSQILESAIERLKAEGAPFQLALEAQNGFHVDVEGRIVSGEAMMQFCDINAQRQEMLKLSDDLENLKIEAIGLRAMLDTLSHPIWLRDRNGRMTWVNEPFVFAVDAESVADVIVKQIEFLDSSSLKQATTLLKLGEVFTARVPVIVAGQRRIYDIVETPLAAGTIGYASDVSDLEATRQDMESQMASHVRTLDQLPTAVAIFDEKQRLQFCNLAYRKLWQLDEAFTLSCPTDSEILDRLRDLRRLPEQADYKSWKKNLHEAYLTLETREMAWYLPGSRTLRVVVNPNPQGGVTYLFEDVTAQFALQSNFNTLSRVQSETLDSLKEGVAVFGVDGRLKLNNPAFGTIWLLEPKLLAKQPHIDEIILATFNLYAETSVWSAIKGAIAGFSDARHGQSFRMERYDGSTIDCALAPLPDGATLITFVDVSASVHVERALKERNEALEQAGQLRENFVHHVSYQLRSPLTNVIGFTELLASGVAGPLTDRQSEYIGHVFQSSNALMAIIDDILDLASFDRGEVVLECAAANIRDVVATAAEGLQDRIQEHSIQMVLNIEENVDTFLIDTKRVRQILFNLLSNAIGFSSEGQAIIVSVGQSELGLSISVQDNGRGIPPEVIDRVFQRFETFTFGSRHRGAGLGLSIVRALVELHGGSVQIESEPGHGTKVTCVFPGPHSEHDAIEAA
jgi:hypothetical protein